MDTAVWLAVEHPNQRFEPGNERCALTVVGCHRAQLSTSLFRLADSYPRFAKPCRMGYRHLQSTRTALVQAAHLQGHQVHPLLVRLAQTRNQSLVRLPLFWPEHFGIA